MQIRLSEWKANQKQKVGLAEKIIIWAVIFAAIGLLEYLALGRI